ncbi:MAG: hypothetical protein WCW56_02840 [Candidatus Paceibacterota bacterium]|jgi:hypothetical protein
MEKDSVEHVISCVSSQLEEAGVKPEIRQIVADSILSVANAYYEKGLAHGKKEGAKELVIAFDPRTLM